MRTLSASAFVGLMILSPLFVAQSIFDGTWRPDPQKPSPGQKPDIIELANGVYDCQSCTPPYKVTADGRDEPVAGNPHYDTLSVAIIDDRTVARPRRRTARP